MSRWFRLYDEMLDDPKMQRLPPATFKAVINLWCLTSKNGGKLPCFEDIAFGLRLSHEEAVKLLDDLVAMGLFDHDNNGLRPHNWDKRQYKSDVTDPTAAERMRRHRNEHRNDTVTVTAPRTDTESEQIQKEKNIGRSRSATRPPSDSDFEEFRKVYPKRAGTDPKTPALKKFQAAVRGGAAPAEIIAGAGRYADDMRKANKIGTEFVKQSMTWLSQRLWEDYAASAHGPPSWRDEMRAVDEQLARAGYGKTTDDHRRDGADNVIELRKEGDVARLPAAKIGGG
jgi:hypothetical protein